MQDFELPFLEAETPVGEAFGPMIDRRVSGIVVGTGSDYRILHFTQLTGFLANPKQTLRDVLGFAKLADATKILGISEMSGPPGAAAREKAFSLGDDYLLLNVDVTNKVAVVCSRHEPGAAMYLASTPGYACDGPSRHYYPPHSRGATNECVVLTCPGHLP